MTELIEINDIAKEIIFVLKYFDANFISKIPIKVLDTLRALAKQSNITISIDKNKKLNEQNISEETINMISLLYYNYVATDEEKNYITGIWNENEKLYNIKNQYDSDNFFKRLIYNGGNK